MFRSSGWLLGSCKVPGRTGGLKPQQAAALGWSPVLAEDRGGVILCHASFLSANSLEFRRTRVMCALVSADSATAKYALASIPLMRLLLALASLRFHVLLSSRCCLDTRNVNDQEACRPPRTCRYGQRRAR